VSTYFGLAKTAEKEQSQRADSMKIGKERARERDRHTDACTTHTNTHILAAVQPEAFVL